MATSQQIPCFADNRAGFFVWSNPLFAERMTDFEFDPCARLQAGTGAARHAIDAGARLTDELRPCTLDSLELPRVDFIKMDVEGAELMALRGGEAALRRHRPRLAISRYHRPEDFFSIPIWLDSLGLGYRFYLDHYTIHHEETVLYAVG